MNPRANLVRIVAKDFVDDTRPVIESAALIAAQAAALLRQGSQVVISVHGLRGVSSSFFNVVLAGVADVLGPDLVNGRFSVDTETVTQRMIFERSLDAFRQPR